MTNGVTPKRDLHFRENCGECREQLVNRCPRDVNKLLEYILLASACLPQKKVEIETQFIATVKYLTTMLRKFLMGMLPKHCHATKQRSRLMAPILPIDM